MDDPEFRELVKKAVFAISVAIVFVIPIFFIFKNKLISETSNVLKDIRKEETFILLIEEEKCNYCKEIKNELKINNIEYKELKKDKEKDYDEIVRKLDLDNDTLYLPTLIYIEKGKVIEYIVDIKSKEDIKTFINSYK